MRRAFTVLSFLSITAASAASAQICAGTAPFSAGPLRVSGIYQFVNDTKMYAAGVALGATDGGPFGGVYVGKATEKDVDETATTYGGHFGFSAPVGTTKKAEVCPMLTLDRLTASLETGFGSADLTGTRLGLGFGVGGIVSGSPTFDLIPFASAAYNRTTSEVSLAGSTDKFNDDIGILTLGAGFVFNKRVTILPNVQIPFGTEDDEDPLWGITLAFNFGKKK